MQDKNEVNSLKRSRDNDQESSEISTRSMKRVRGNSILEEFIYRLEDNDSMLLQLNLSFYQITGVRAQEISEALAKNTIVRQLNLSDNQIGDSGTQAISVALVKNTTLTQLNLRGNNISAIGAEGLSAALAINTTLIQLNLGYNDIGDTGVQKLSEVLAKNTILTQLNVECNDIADIGSQALKTVLATNMTLIQVDLLDNPIDDAVLEEINLQISRNQEIALKKQASLESIKKSAKVLSILSRHRNGIFFSLPREINIKIAGLTGDSDVHDEAKSIEIANHYFK